MALSNLLLAVHKTSVSHEQLNKLFDRAEDAAQMDVILNMGWACGQKHGMQNQSPSRHCRKKASNTNGDNPTKNAEISKF